MTSASRFKEFLDGFFSPLRVLRLLLEHPQLFILFILPIVLTVTAIAIAIYAVLVGAWTASQTLFHTWFGQSFAIGSGILATLAGLLLAYFFLISLNLLIQLAASPFNDLLAEGTEKALNEPVPPFSILHLIHVFFLDLRKTVLNLGLTALFLVIGLIPFMGIISLLGLALVQTLSFVAYPQSRRRHGVMESVAWIRRNPFLSLGFGLASLLLFSVPVINLFALPVSVMAGTLVYLKK